MDRLARAFRRHVLARPWLCFVVLCASFLLFGIGTLNLVGMFRLNLTLIAENGTMALADGAAQQFGELVLSLVASMLGYIVFKACEHELVHRITHPEQAPEKEKEPGP